MRLAVDDEPTPREAMQACGLERLDANPDLARTQHDQRIAVRRLVHDQRDDGAFVGECSGL